MSSIGDNIEVNGFMVCKQHGDELCPRCPCDHRMGNNHAKGLYEVFAEGVEAGFDLEKRTPQNAFARGAIPVRTGSESYKCRTHNARDCERCFDRVGIIRREIEDAQAQEAWLDRRRRWLDRVDYD